MDTIAPSYQALRERIDAALSAFLSAERRELAGADPAAAALLEELVAVVQAGGKRLRPAFCYWGYRAAGGPDGEPIVRAAASLEVFHTFAIVHDDIMDGSPLRRGRPSAHVTLGTGGAILAGDLAFVLADRMLAESGFSAERVAAAFEWFNRMRIDVVAGQYADLQAARAGAEEPAARRIAALKSGSYSVEKPMAIGATLAGGARSLIEALSAFGRPLGEAFQLRDDVLGAFGEPAITGKDADADLREGKATVLVAKARAMATPTDRAFLDERLGARDLSAADADRLRSVLRSSGALEGTLALIRELRAQALAALDRAGFEPQTDAALRELAERATDRHA